MKKDIHNMKFATQLHIAFSIVIVFIAFLILLGLYLLQWKIYRDRTFSRLEVQAKQIATNIDNKLDYYLSFANMLVLNEGLTTALANDNFDTAESILDIETRKLMTLYFGKVHRIKLYRINCSGGDQNAQLSNQIDEYIKGNSDLVWTKTYYNERNQKVFSLFQKIYQTNLSQEYYLEVSIYETELFSLFKGDNEGYKISIINKGMLMSSSDRKYMDKILKQQKDTGLEPLSNLYSWSKENEIHVSAKCKIGWEVNIDGRMDYLTRKYLEGFSGIVPVFLISMFFAFMCIFMISNKLSKRMSILHKKIDYISQFDLEQNLPIYGNDEFKVISDALEVTRERILNLITQINQINELKRVAEMVALRSQINSHFLFNSLSTIKSLSYQKNQDSFLEAVDKLSYILRYSLSLDEDLVTLSIELEYLKAYIYLEKLRFGEDITIDIDVDKELLSCKTVKIILQPLVENSIYHGRRKDGSGLNIRIYSYYDDQYYYLVVEDDGNGMTDEKISEIYEKEYKDADEGYSLFNVMNRIRMCTENSGTLTIQSKLMSYTKITICQVKTN